MGNLFKNFLSEKRFQWIVIWQHNLLLQAKLSPEPALWNCPLAFKLCWTCTTQPIALRHLSLLLWPPRTRLANQPSCGQKRVPDQFQSPLQWECGYSLSRAKDPRSHNKELSGSSLLLLVLSTLGKFLAQGWSPIISTRYFFGKFLIEEKDSAFLTFHCDIL